MKIVTAYKFRLAPTFEQRVALWGCAEHARRAWNWTVDLCEQEYVEALVVAGVLDRADLEGCKRKQKVAVLAKAGERARKLKVKLKKPSINRGRLYQAWCQMRETTRNTWYYSHVYSYPIERVVQTYRNFWTRKGGNHGAPVPHGPTHPSSFTIQLQRRSWKEGRIKVPGVGWIATLWSDRGRRCGEDPMQRIPEGKPCSVTVTRRANDWYASIAIKDVESNESLGDGVAGIDLGVSAVITTSAGERIDPPRPLQAALRQLAKLQRRRQRKPKRSRRRMLLDIQVAKLHARVAEIRANHLHNVSTSLARRYRSVVVEGFDVRQMVEHAVKYRKRRRAIMDLGWGELRRQIQYKLERRGGELMVAPQFHPTNRQCATCWTADVMTFNECPPEQAIYNCSTCGSKMTRQANTAMLLESFGRGHWPPEGTGAQPGPDARGGSESVARDADPVKREHPPSRGGALVPPPGDLAVDAEAGCASTQDPKFPTSEGACEPAVPNQHTGRRFSRRTGAVATGRSSGG